MAYIPKEKVDIVPRVVALNNRVVESNLDDVYLFRDGDTTSGYYYFNGQMYVFSLSANTFSAYTATTQVLSSTTISATTYYSGATPLSQIFVTTGQTLFNGTGSTVPLFINRSGTTLYFNTLSGNNITITQANGVITLSANTQAGQSYSGTNKGDGVNIYTGNTGSTFFFRTLSGSSAITITQVGDLIHVQDNMNGSNIGSGSQVFSSRSNNLLQFRSIYGAGGTSVSTVGNSIKIQTGTIPTIPPGAYLWTTGYGTNSLRTNNGYTQILTPYSQYSIVAGKLNIAHSKYTAILNGDKNYINEFGANEHRGEFNAIANGYKNYIYSSKKSIIGNGYYNKIILSYFSSILNGYLNSINTDYNITYNAYNRSRHNTILNGIQNQITSSKAPYSRYNTIANGDENRIESSKASSILAGRAHYIDVANYSAIIGGTSLSLNDSNTVLVPYLQIANVSSGGNYMLTWNNSNRKVYRTTLPGAPGEANTASNLGGVGLYFNKVGVDLRFRGLSAGTGIGITQQTNTVTITYTGSTSSATPGGSNIPGLNTYTGGTLTAQTINISALTSINSLTVSGSTGLNTLSAVTLSANTIVSGSTNLYNVFTPIGSISGINASTQGYKIYTGNTINNNLAFRTLVASGGTTMAQTSANTIVIYSPPVPLGASRWTIGDYGVNPYSSIKSLQSGLNYIDGRYSLVAGHGAYVIKANYSFVHGYMSRVGTGNSMSIITGHYNYISGSNYASIINGNTNQIYSHSYGLIANGIANKIYSTAGIGQNSTILNGSSNRILKNANGGNFSTVLNGFNHFISGASYSSIVGGVSNIVSGNHSAIIGGTGATLSFSKSVLLPYAHINHVPNASGTSYALLWNSATKRVHKSNASVHTNVSANISANAISATTVSASTLYSGTTELSKLFPYDFNFYRKVGTGSTIGERWYHTTGIGGTPTSISTTVNTMYLVPYIVPHTIKLDRLAINCTTTGTSANAQIGIYNADSLQLNPTTLVLDAGSVSLQTTGIKSITINQTLSGGLYYMAFICTGGTPQVTGLSTVNMLPIFGYSSALTGSVAGTNLNITGANYGPLPTDLTTSAVTVSTNTAPMVFSRLT